jgi:glycosyltransferase involved in cell wall biosynthesis
MIRARNTGDGATPRLSVIVPTYNRARVLGKCLDALTRQTLEAGQYEVLVVDDGSQDETRATALDWAAAFPGIRYQRQNNAGANAARNRAMECARGEILLLINDDVLAIPDMLAQHLAAHDRYPDVNVACLGRVTALPTLPRTRLAWLHLDRAFDNLAGRTELDWRAFFTCNVSLKRELANRAGGFEERLRYHEDLEFAERLSHYGLRVVYWPQALGYHDHLLTEEEFLSIGKREAKALAIWAGKAPGLHSTLATLGYEPALPAWQRRRQAVAGLAVNHATIPFWMWLARQSPERISHKIYGRVYQAVRRKWLRRELRGASPSTAGRL